jgi:arginyl-tRNA--protein-N-Asp/Glu arginylyltransferase
LVGLLQEAGSTETDVTTPTSSADIGSSRDQHPSASVDLPTLPLSDHQHPCVYRPSQIARMPLLYPTRMLTPDELDSQLARGRRRSGVCMYYTACPACVSCEPTRLDLGKFTLSRSMKRVLHRGDRCLSVQIGIPQAEANRLELFNRHRMQRDLASQRESYSVHDYRSFLVDSCCESYELSCWWQSQLVACSVIDCGRQSLSAVYTYFDPDFSHFSLGTYAILKQWEWAVSQKKSYLYLGMYVEDNQHLRYKARFAPQQRLIAGRWVEFTEPMTDWSVALDAPPAT